MDVAKRIQQWFASKLTQNAVKLLLANVVAQAIGFCIYPLLTRLYSPDHFGLLNLFLSIGGVLLLLATGSYYSAIVLPKQAEQGVACFHVGMGCNLLVTLLCALSLFFATDIATLFNVPELATWYYLLPLFVFLSATWQLLNYWYVRNQQFGDVSTYQVCQSSINAGAKSAFGYAGFLQGGMVISVVLAPLLSLAIVVARSFSSVKALFCVQPKLCKEVAKTYHKFPLFSLPKQLVNYIGGNLPIFLLTPFFDLSYIGYFGMALTLSFVPISLITRSLYQVLFAHVTQLVHQHKSIWKSYRRYVVLALCVLVIGFAVLAIILPDLTIWLLGDDKWRMVGIYIQLMLPWLGVIALTNTFDFIFDIFGKQDKQFYFELALFVLRALALLWGIYLHEVWWAVMAFSYVSFLVRLLYAGYQCYLIYQYEKNDATPCNSR